MGFGFTSNPLNENTNTVVLAEAINTTTSTTTNNNNGNRKGVGLFTVFIGYLIFIIIIGVGFSYMKKQIDDTNNKVTILSQELMNLQIKHDR